MHYLIGNIFFYYLISLKLNMSLFGIICCFEIMKIFPFKISNKVNYFVASPKFELLNMKPWQNNIIIKNNILKSQID